MLQGKEDMLRRRTLQWHSLQRHRLKRLRMGGEVLLSRLSLRGLLGR